MAPIQAAGQTLEAGAPVGLFQSQIVGGGQSKQRQQYAVASDGRFLINNTADESTPSLVTIVTTWARALKK